MPMEQRELIKNFVKSWVRYDLDIQSVEGQVKNELSKEGAAHQMAGWLYEQVLSQPDRRREIALRLALAEFQETLAQM